MVLRYCHAWGFLHTTVPLFPGTPNPDTLLGSLGSAALCRHTGASNTTHLVLLQNHTAQYYDMIVSLPVGLQPSWLKGVGCHTVIYLNDPRSDPGTPTSEHV